MWGEVAMPWDRVWCNANLMTLDEKRGGLGIIHNGVIAAIGERIAFVGSMEEMPRRLDAREVIHCRGRWITPGLVDCHTHLIYAGNRVGEFELRAAGATYEEISRAGGGLHSTVRATRAASREELVAAALRRLDVAIADGVTTIEIKSGYGLDIETEVRQLQAAQDLASGRSIDVIPTFLGAHAFPTDWCGDRRSYLDFLCGEVIPLIVRERLATSLDAFCETIAFTIEETAHIFNTACSMGMRVKLHADQLSNSGGAALAARFHALSADHLEHTDENGVQAMAAAGTTAVLLPGAFYFLRETQAPPIAYFRRHLVPMAIATDMNPGSSPLISLLFAMNIAATQLRLTTQECIAGVTREAARALGRLDTIGTLERGKRCDLAIWDIEQPGDLVYYVGFNPLAARVWAGKSDMTFVTKFTGQR
jgi:imidazolonepropionase